MARLLEELTSQEVDAFNREETIVLLPIGATEQHGKHLPVGTDTMILKSVLDRVLKDIDPEIPLLITPVIPVGKSNEHLNFIGTISFSYATLRSVIEDICKSIARHGFKKIAIFNSHGGNTDTLTSLCRDLRDQLNVQVFVIDWWFTNFWEDILKEIQESPRDGVFHACELETSIIMYTFPHLVKREQIVASFPPEPLRSNKYVTIFGPVTMGWRTEDISANGVIGDPTKATSEKGRLLVEFAARKIIEIIQEIQSL